MNSWSGWSTSSGGTSVVGASGPAPGQPGHAVPVPGLTADDEHDLGVAGGDQVAGVPHDRQLEDAEVGDRRAGAGCAQPVGDDPGGVAGAPRPLGHEDGADAGAEAVHAGVGEACWPP